MLYYVLRGKNGSSARTERKLSYIIVKEKNECMRKTGLGRDGNLTSLLSTHNTKTYDSLEIRKQATPRIFLRKRHYGKLLK